LIGRVGGEEHETLRADLLGVGQGRVGFCCFCIVAVISRLVLSLQVVVHRE
jgi:hypothetical protein